jgi:hypothetical protein
MPSNRTNGVRLMHDHVNVLPTAVVAAQTANQSPHHEVRAETLGERCRAEDGRVLALEADRADVEAGADLIGERGGRSWRRFRHSYAYHLLLRRRIAEMAERVA